ncbi:unnamed protein product [Ectocarpus sp. 6 AP-2014]
MGRLAAETPSPMPSMAMPSSQESAGSSYFWGSQPDEPLSQGQQQQAQQDAIYSSSQPLFGHGRQVGSTAVGSVGADGGVNGRVGGHGGHDRDRDSVAMQDAGPSSTLPTDDREDESGVDSAAGGKSHHRKKAAKARGRGRGAVKSRRGGGDGGGSDTSCSKEKDTSRDGRRTWTDAESDRLREVVEHRSAGDSRKNWQWVAAKVSEVSPRGPGDSEGGTPHPDGGINPNRKTPSQCKMRWERILNPGVKRGLWTKEEDQKLKEVAAAMEYKWSHVAKLMGGRTYKQCRERYTNYLKEGLNVGPWTKEEDQLLLSMHAKVGNKWAEIARYLKDRSENMIKNEYMKLSRDANASQRRRQAHIDNHSSHTQNSLDSNTNPNGHEVVVSGSPTAGEGGDGEVAKAKKRKGKQPLKGTGGPASSSTSPTPLPDGEAEARHSVGGLWGVTPAPIGTVRGSFFAAARSAESSSFLGEPPAVKLEQQYQHQQQQWQQQQLAASVPRLQQHHQQQQQLRGPAGFLVPSSAAGTGVFPTTTAASMAIANPAGGGLGVGNVGFPPHVAARGGSGDGSGAVGPAGSPLGGAASGSDIPSFMM